MRGTFKHDRKGVRVQIDQAEREALVHLLTQLDELLDDGQAEPDDPLALLVGLTGFEGSEPPRQTPEDPAVARLLPDAHRDDPELAVEFRRLTEYSLRSRKRTGARTAAAALSRPEPVHLDDDEALCLLKAMTDIRLVLGERLELRTDEDAETLHDRLWAGDGEPGWLAIASTYELLTVWQEHLVGAVSRRH
jgi:Domain of unknown function (DUF2017)